MLRVKKDSGTGIPSYTLSPLECDDAKSALSFDPWYGKNFALPFFIRSAPTADTLAQSIGQDPLLLLTELLPGQLPDFCRYVAKSTPEQQPQEKAKQLNVLHCLVPPAKRKLVSTQDLEESARNPEWHSSIANALRMKRELDTETGLPGILLEFDEEGHNILDFLPIPYPVEVSLEELSAHAQSARENFGLMANYFDTSVANTILQWAELMTPAGLPTLPTEDRVKGKDFGDAIDKRLAECASDPLILYKALALQDRKQDIRYLDSYLGEDIIRFIQRKHLRGIAYHRIPEICRLVDSKLRNVIHFLIPTAARTVVSPDVLYQFARNPELLKQHVMDKDNYVHGLPRLYFSVDEQGRNFIDYLRNAHLNAGLLDYLAKHPKELLEYCRDPQAIPQLLCLRDHKNRSILHYIASADYQSSFGYFQAILAHHLLRTDEGQKALLEADHEGYTPIHRATFYAMITGAHVNCLKNMLQAVPLGSDLLTKTRQGDTLLHLALKTPSQSGTSQNPVVAGVVKDILAATKKSLQQTVELERQTQVWHDFLHCANAAGETCEKLNVDDEHSAQVALYLKNAGMRTQAPVTRYERRPTQRVELPQVTCTSLEVKKDDSSSSSGEEEEDDDDAEDGSYLSDKGERSPSRSPTPQIASRTVTSDVSVSRASSEDGARPQPSPSHEKQAKPARTRTRLGKRAMGTMLGHQHGTGTIKKAAINQKYSYQTIMDRVTTELTAYEDSRKLLWCYDRRDTQRVSSAETIQLHMIKVSQSATTTRLIFNLGYLEALIKLIQDQATEAHADYNKRHWIKAFFGGKSGYGKRLDKLSEGLIQTWDEGYRESGQQRYIPSFKRPEK